MNSKELRKLNKNELVDRILELDVVIEKLQVRVEELQDQVSDRELKIEQAGSLADAALSVNGVIEAAQKAADQYLENIETLNEKTTKLCLQQEEESKAKCQAQEEECTARCRQLEADTKKRCEELDRATQKKCEALERECEDKINARWAEFTQKVDRYIAAHGDLKQILSTTVEK